MAAIEQILQYTYPSNNNNNAVLIDNIPQTYRHLEIIWSGKTVGTGAVEANVRLNNDSGAYAYLGCATNNNSGSIYAQGQYGLTYIQGKDGATAKFDNFGGATKIMIYDYANTTRYTQLSGISSYNEAIAKFAGLWNNNSAVTSIQFTAPSNTMHGEGKIFINGWNDFANA